MEHGSENLGRVDERWVYEDFRRRAVVAEGVSPAFLVQVVA